MLPHSMEYMLPHSGEFKRSVDSRPRIPTFLLSTAEFGPG
jgi:hypothetical protein